MNPATDSKDIIIGFSVDYQYWLGALVMLRSVLDNCSNPGLLQFIGVDAGLASNERLVLKRIARSYGARLNWLEFPTTQRDGLLNGGGIAKATQAKFMFADLLPSTHQKLLYLDCDIIVLSDLTELYALDVRGYPLLACPERRLTDNIQRETKSNIRLELLTPSLSPSLSFNCGVLLLNLEYWRQTKLGESIDQHLQHLLHSQTASIVNTSARQCSLNAVLSGQWGKLDSLWNYQWNYQIASTLIREQELKLLGELLKQETNPMLPKIIHFVSGIKPWQHGYAHPAKQIFFNYIDRTHMKGWRPIAIDRSP